MPETLRLRSRRRGIKMLLSITIASLAAAFTSTLVGFTASAADSGLAIVITSDKQVPGSDGWVRFTDGSKQWIDSSCRNDLGSRGVATEVLSWTDIAAMPDGPQRPCDAIISSDSGEEQSGDAGKAGSLTAIVITPDKQSAGSDGWVRFSHGAKQWVSADCRADLEAGDVTVQVLSWAEIAAMDDDPQQSCADLLSRSSGDNSATTAPTTTTTITTTSGATSSYWQPWSTT